LGHVLFIFYDYQHQKIDSSELKFCGYVLERIAT